jgi:hypothetical protein
MDLVDGFIISYTTPGDRGGTGRWIDPQQIVNMFGYRNEPFETVKDRTIVREKAPLPVDIVDFPG